MVFAIIEEGGRQLNVEQGQRVRIDYRADSQVGDEIKFDRVLLANGGSSSTIGQPLIQDATVSAKVIEPEDKGPKLEVQKLRRRKNSRRHTGHRQKYTLVEITAVDVPGLEVVEEKQAAAT